MSLLFHLSDLHFGREDRAALEWVKALVQAEKPDALIVTGDLTMRARQHEFAAAAVWLKSLSTATVIEPGNHDIPVLNPWNRMFRPFERVERIEEEIEHVPELGDVWLVPLNTVRRAQWRMNWASGAVRSAALSHALKRLAQKPPGVLGLVTCHHPLVAVGDMRHADRTFGGKIALEQLAASGADAVLSGHVHDPFDVEWRDGKASVRLIGAGTLSERIRSTRPSFNQLVVENGQLTLTLRTM
jgi:3',5'-cyclic AMP phosphodiesterase CpdA